MKRKIFSLPIIAPDVIGHMLLSLPDFSEESIKALEKEMAEENEYLACLPFALGEILSGAPKTHFDERPQKSEEKRRLVVSASLMTLLAVNDQLQTGILEDLLKKTIKKTQRTKRRAPKTIAKKKRLRSV